MSTADAASPIANVSPEPDVWPDVRRVEEWAGEMRANMIRVVGIVLFYGRHLLEFMMADPASKIRGPYHLRITWIIGAWAAAAILIGWQLQRRRVLPPLKYLTAALDLFMITLVCLIAGGPRTPLVLLFFLVIAMAPLRLSLRLVYFTTAGAGAGYLCLLAFYAWYVVGYEKYYATPEVRIPRSEEAIYLLAMLVAGLLAGQTVRQARRLASGYPVAALPASETREGQ